MVQIFGLLLYMIYMLLPVLALIWAFRLLWKIKIKKTTGLLHAGRLIIASIVLLFVSVTLFEGIWFGEPNIRTRRRRTIADMEFTTKAIEQYKIDNNLVPQTNFDGLSAILMSTYIENMPQEDWFGNSFIYTPIDDKEYVLISPGMGEPLFGRFYRSIFYRDGQLDTPSSESDSNFQHDLIIHNGTFIASPDTSSDIGSIKTLELLKQIGAER